MTIPSLFDPSCLRAFVAIFICSAWATACGRTLSPPGPTNDLLIVGYDREPDTLNRFSTHILEDIQTCVIEGLTITDDKMNIVPLLAAEVPSLANGGVVLRPDGGMDVTWKLRPDVTWHDGTPFTSADVKFTVEAINDPELQPREHGRLRSDLVGGHARSADRSRALQGDLRAVRTAVRARDVSAPHPAGTRHRSRQPTTIARRSGPVRIAWRNGRAASTSASSAWPKLLARAATPAIRQILFRFVANTNTRINQLKTGEVHLVAMFPADKHREVAGDPWRHRASHARQRLRARDAQRAPHRRVQGRARPPRVDARDRSRARSSKSILDGLAPITHGPIQPVSWAFTDDTVRVRLRRRTRPRAARRGRLARARAGRRPPEGRRAARVHPDHSGRLRRARAGRRRCCSGSSATSAWT